MHLVSVCLMKQMRMDHAKYDALVKAAGVQPRRPGPRARPSRTACFRSIPWGVTEEQLMKDFGECGQINGVGLPPKVAIVTFETSAATEKALESDPPSPRRCHRLGTKVFMGGIPWSETEEQLMKVFRPFGQINEVALPAKYAFITFKTSAAIKKALEFSGKVYRGNALTVTFAQDNLTTRRAKATGVRATMANDDDDGGEE